MSAPRIASATHSAMQGATQGATRLLAGGWLRAHAWDPRPGDAAIARALLEGGEAGLGLAAARPSDDFAWLRHALAGDARLQARARAFACAWASRRLSASARLPDDRARRIMAWLSAAPALFGALDGDRARLLARRLEDDIKACEKAMARDTPDAFAAAAAVAYAGVCMPDSDARAAHAFDALARASTKALLADGGHVSRAPDQAFAAALALTRLRAVCASAGRAFPATCARALTRVSAAVRFFRHADGALATFHGAQALSPREVRATLARQGSQSRPFGFAPQSRYQRLAAGDAVALVDVGTAPSRDDALDDAMAMELSANGARVVVSAGVGERPASTLYVFAPERKRLLSMGTRRGQASRVDARRLETQDGIWLDASCPAAGGRGYTRARRLFLAADGSQARGEDEVRLSPGVAQGGADILACVVFHLHPDVRAGLDASGTSAWLAPPNGDVWRLRVSGPRGGLRGGLRGSDVALGLEPGLYAGDGAPRKTRKLVIAARGLAPSFRWAFARVRQQ